jgi:hypothetical protein
MDKRAGRDRNFHFYTSLALLFTLTGTRLLLNGTSLSFAWIIVAVMMSWLGWTHARFSLTVHATVAVIAAVFYNHIPAFAAAAFIGTMPVGLMPSPSQGIVLAGAAICLWWPLPPSTDTGQVWVRIQRFLLTLVLVSGIGGSLISITAFFLAQPHGKPDAGVLATIRTIVLSISALVLAWMGRHRKFEEWGWLLYPVLAATGFKMLFEDFPSSRPGTLFLALAAYGAVLILSPRLRRKPDAP